MKKKVFLLSVQICINSCIFDVSSSSVNHSDQNYNKNQDKILHVFVSLVLCVLVLEICH